MPHTTHYSTDSLPLHSSSTQAFDPKKGFCASSVIMEAGGGEEAGCSSAPKVAECGNGDDAIASCCSIMVEGQEERKDGSDQEEIDGEDEEHEFVPGPRLSLKDELEKDKDDESLRRWKEKLLGYAKEIDGLNISLLFLKKGIINM